MKGCLEGIRVLDLSRIIAAPLATQMLADLGAEVIKVERPGTGDDTRRWGPVYLDTGDEQRAPESAYFLSANRGKKSVVVDLSHPAGSDLVRQLAAQSDIVVENHKVGSLARFGLDYSSLSVANPRLIYCSLTGYGQTGPYARLPSYDLVIQAQSGFMSATGHADESPGGGPMRSAVPFADILAGAYACIGILAALEHRHLTGKGQQVDIALLDAMITSMPNVHLPYLIGGRVLPRTGNSNPNVYPNESFPCADGHLILAVANDSQFAALCATCGVPDLAIDPRFSTNDARSRNRADLGPILEAILDRAPVSDWVERLRASGVPCGPVNRIDQVFEDAQVRDRGLAVEFEYPGGTVAPLLANPMRFSAMDLAYGRPPPRLGQDTEDVLSSVLSLSKNEIDALRTSRVIET